MPPTVSVLVPCYQDGEFLGETLESLLAQTFDDFEVVVSDEGVDPTCESVARQYADPRIRYFRNSHRLGMTRNWNAALGHATGERIIKLDGDDVMSTETLARLSAALDDSPHCQFAACLADDCNDTLQDCSLYGARGYELAKLDPHMDSALSANEIFPWLFDDSQLWHSCALMFRRPALELLAGWDEQWGCASDTDIILRAFNQGWALAHVGVIGVRYRRRSTSVSARFRQDSRLAWESALIHLAALQRWSQADNPMSRPLRIAWYRHWHRLQDLRHHDAGIPAEYVEALKEIQPPPLGIRLMERTRMAAHRLKSGAR